MMNVSGDAVGSNYKGIDDSECLRLLMSWGPTNKVLYKNKTLSETPLNRTPEIWWLLECD